MKDGQTIGQWLKWDFEANQSLIIRDYNNNVLYFEDRQRNWRKSEYDYQDNLIYCEDNNGTIVDNRTPEIIEHNGRKYKLMP